jgi:hypothetical protein
MDSGEAFASSYPLAVHAWRPGSDTLVIGLGAKAVVDYALQFKRAYGPGTWVCGYVQAMIRLHPLPASLGGRGRSVLAQHSTPSMSIDTYAKASLHDARGAVESQPDLTAHRREAIAATGTRCQSEHM